MRRLCAVLLAALLCLAGCNATNKPEQSAGEPTVAADNETKPVIYPAGTAAQEECVLCGTNSIWGYYKTLDSIGVINLASGNISDLRIFEYEDNGDLKDNSGRSSMLTVGDGDGRRGNMMVMGGRGICDLTLTWDEGKEITLEEIAPLYCPDCMKKIAELDADSPERFPSGKRCPFAMIDFVTGYLYSLNGICTACFIRDYYMNFEFGEREITGVVVYAPERFPKE